MKRTNSLYTDFVISLFLDSYFASTKWFGSRYSVKLGRDCRLMNDSKEALQASLMK